LAESMSKSARGELELAHGKRAASGQLELDLAMPWRI